MDMKRKHVVSATIIITTLTKSKPLLYLRYNNIGPKIKKEILKFGFRVVFQTDPNLNNILCKNKDKLIPNTQLGVYGLKSSCG